MIVDVQFPEKLAFLVQEQHRYKVAHSGRGAAKSWSFAAAALILGIQKPLRIVCARETMKSLKDSVHTLLEDTIDRLKLRSIYEVQQSGIFGSNGTEFTFVGLRHNVESVKSLEGADVLWVEEASTVSKASWDTVIPTIRKPNSEIWVSYNPELDTDDTHRRFVVNPPPNAKVARLTWRDNPWFPETLRIEMEHMRATDPIAFDHVWEGNTKSAVEGAIFGEELKKADAEKRIASVPWDRTKPVDTFWDLGFTDKTAIWFAQPVAGWYHLIDYMEGAGKTISDYVVALQQRGYMYGTDWLPHDGTDTVIHTRLPGDKSRSPEQIMRASGRRVRITPKMLVSSQINAARTIFPQCRFDADKCAQGLHALRQYQWGENAASGQERRQPLHDWASHSASGFMNFAVNMRHPELQAPQAAAQRPPSNLHSWMAAILPWASLIPVSALYLAHRAF